jgi:hypothetical protein
MEEKIENDKLLLLRKLSSFILAFNAIFFLVNFRADDFQYIGIVYYIVQFSLLACSFLVKLRAILISTVLMQLYTFSILFRESGLMFAEEQDKIKLSLKIYIFLYHLILTVLFLLLLSFLFMKHMLMIMLLFMTIIFASSIHFVHGFENVSNPVVMVFAYLWFLAYGLFFIYILLAIIIVDRNRIKEFSVQFERIKL